MGERAGKRENFRPPVSGEHSVFEMSGRQTIGGDHGPAIGERLDAIGAEVDHGLDGKGHAGLDLVSCAAAAEVWDLRLFMHRPTDSVAHKIADNTKTMRLDKRLDGMGNVPDAIANLCLADAELEGLLGGLKQHGDFGTDGADGYGDGVVADVSVGFDRDIE